MKRGRERNGGKIGEGREKLLGILGFLYLIFSGSIVL